MKNTNSLLLAHLILIHHSMSHSTGGEGWATLEILATLIPWGGGLQYKRSAYARTEARKPDQERDHFWQITYP